VRCSQQGCIENKNGFRMMTGWGTRLEQREYNVDSRVPAST